MNINKLSDRIKHYLSCELADEWSTKVKDNMEFSITIDDGDFLISGNDICLDMICDIKEIIDKAMEEEKDNKKNVISFNDYEVSEIDR